MLNVMIFVVTTQAKKQLTKQQKKLAKLPVSKRQKR
jgi:hypothetical protein